jgi:hypothetical protein
LIHSGLFSKSKNRQAFKGLCEAEIRKHPEPNIMKVIIKIGILISLLTSSANAQEGCNGPVFMAGSSTGNCTCSPTPPNCTGGPVTYRNDYYTCGGSGYLHCGSMTDVVGRSSVACIQSYDLAAAILLQQAYDDCLIDKNRNHPPGMEIECIPPSDPRYYCTINPCVQDPNSGSPITASVLYELGDECNIAMWRPPGSAPVEALYAAILK